MRWGRLHPLALGEEAKDLQKDRREHEYPEEELG